MHGILLSMLTPGASFPLACQCLAGATSACASPPSSPPSSGVANLWVDSDGGGCVRKATASAYVSADACQSFDAAWDAMSAGDTARVRAGGYGQQVRLAHSAGMGSSYSHMSRIIVAPGSFVHQGQLIGYVGTSGLSTGAHLHYEVYRNGAAVNPLGVRFASQSLLAGEELARFRSRLAQLMAIGTGAAAPKDDKRPGRA